jgi:hypothetical protein
MPLPQSVDEGARYVLTEQGRQALLDPETCACHPHLSALLVVCDDCGTVYGHLNELDRRKENIRRRTRWGR